MEDSRNSCLVGIKAVEKGCSGLLKKSVRETGIGGSGCVQGVRWSEEIAKQEWNSVNGREFEEEQGQIKSLI